MDRKRVSQHVAFGLFRLLSLSVVLILFAILGFIIYKGIGVINWEFITTPPKDGMTAGGIWPAIVGTFYLMAGSALFAFPVGVMSGIYMNEYAPRGWIVRFIRMMTNNLSGIPSIVFGLFGMALFVNYLDFGDSILAGSLTLGLLSLPLVIRTTEEALKAIPDSLREGSRALGATKLQTIWHVILPMGMPNIITGLILALGRVSGETAPIQRAGPVHGVALPPVRHLHQRGRHGGTAAHSLRHGAGAHRHHPPGEPAGQRPAQILREKGEDKWMTKVSVPGLNGSSPRSRCIQSPDQAYSVPGPGCSSPRSRWFQTVEWMWNHYITMY